MPQVQDVTSTDALDRVLEVDDGSGTVFHFPMRGTRVVIGRTEGADLRLDRASVSRRHAELTLDKFGRWWIRDLKSSNGTKVNGFDVIERVVDLADRIDLGEFSLTLAMPQSRMLNQAPTQGQAVAVRSNDVAPERISTIRATATERPRISTAHLSMLMDLSRHLQTTERLGERLRMLCATMIESPFNGEAAVVVRLPRRTATASAQTLCAPVCRPGFSTRSLTISNGLVDALKQRAEPMMVAATGSTESDETLAGFAALASPIRSDEDAVDLLYVLVGPDYASEEWLTLVSLATEHCRQAENAWQARQMARISASVEVDLERARDIQTRLVPRNVRVPGLDLAIGFEPCRWVAGDYVDILPQADGGVILILADVCGKGMAAALVASSIHTLVHATFTVGADLSALANILNEHLRRFLPQAKFVTAILVRLDPATGKMAFINAGHPPPLVIQSDGGRRTLDVAGYQPLGLSAEVYIATPDQLGPHDMLALYSDGLSELRDASGTMLTAMRLGDHLVSLCRGGARQPVQLVADQFKQVLDNYRADGLPSDDQTFLLARWEGRNGRG